PDVLIRVILELLGLRDLQRTAKSGEDRQRDADRQVERILDEVPGKGPIRVFDSTLSSRSQGGSRRIETGALEAGGGSDHPRERQCGAYRVFEHAALGLTLCPERRLLQQQGLIGLLVGESSPNGGCEQTREERRPRHAHSRRRGVSP